jgi:hypothetical protein
MALRSNSKDGISRPGNASSDAELSGEGISDLQLRWREALVLWLRWNQAYEHVTERMFQAGEDPEQLQQYMDRMEEMRREAIAQSHQLLD